MYSNKAVIYYLKFLKESGYNYLARDKVVKNKQIISDYLCAYISEPHKSSIDNLPNIRWVSAFDDHSKCHYIGPAEKDMIMNKKKLWPSKVYSIDKLIKELEAKENENKFNE